tara:strand:+ start:73 stop:744 length:672 start_codon:yes stop_codon:yes gene_type:complete
MLDILTGFGLGALHVITGPDHMVAMAPSAIAKPKVALKDGLAWGVGHSAGVLILSLFVILAKGLFDIGKVSDFAEMIVGITLLIIGAMAIRTSFRFNIHEHEHEHKQQDGMPHKHFHFHSFGNSLLRSHSHTATGIGVLHGFAGMNHFLGIAPSFALSFAPALAYLFSYLLGSVFAMGCVVLGISFATKKANKSFYPFLMRFIGGASIGLGIYWLQKTSIITF